MYRLLVVLLSILLLAGCGPQPVETLAPGPGPTATSPAPSAEPPDLTQAPSPAAPTATLPPANAPLTQPTMLARYDLAAGEQGESIAAGPGKVWVGTTGGAVLEFDAASGALRSTFALLDGSLVNPTPVLALAFDGVHLWALARSTVEGTQYKTLFVLDPDSGATVHQVDVSDSDPEQVGLAPGQVWLQNAVFDTGTYQSTPLEMATDSSVFAYDGAGMWVGGAATTCDECENMLYRFAGGTLDIGPSASQQITALAAAGDRLWVLTDFNQLDGYTLAAGLNADASPDPRVDLSGDHDFPPAAMLYDGSRLWLLGSVGKGSGRIFQHNPQTGKREFALLVGDTSEVPENASIPLAMAYDGQDLWVLTALHLVRVGLPPK